MKIHRHTDRQTHTQMNCDENRGDVINTSAYIRCAHSGPSTRSLCSLGLRALRSVALFSQALCFEFAFSVALLPRTLYFILASTLAFCARLRRCARLHHHHLKKKQKKPACDGNRTCTHVLIRSAAQRLNHSATKEARELDCFLKQIACFWLIFLALLS